MDRIWKGPNFQEYQFSDFHFVDFDKDESDLPPPQLPPSSVSDGSEESPSWSPASVVQYMPDEKELGRGYRRTMHSREVDGEADWAKFLDSVPDVLNRSDRPSLSMIMLPRCPPLPNRVLPNAQVLMSLPFSKQTFRKVVSKFHVHQALQIILFRGAPVIHRVRYTVPQDNGPPLECISYILRTSVANNPDLALSLTYVRTPPHRVYAVLFGCSGPTDLHHFHAALEFAGPAALQPFTLINAFLDFEKRRRFDNVDDYSRRITDFAENKGTLTGDIEGVVRTYRGVTVLREELEVWRGEMARFTEESERDFVKEMDVGGGKVMGLLEAGGYLRRLGGGYAEKGRVCEGVLQTAGFAFQAEATAMQREDTKTMKAIAVLTMLFLPATFVCTFLAMGIFDWHASPGKKPKEGDEEESHGILAPLWWIFFPLSLGLTAVVWYVFVRHGTGQVPFRGVWIHGARLAESMRGKRGKALRSVV